MTTKFTKREKTRLVKNINKAPPKLHEQLLLTIYRHEKEKNINISCSSNSTKTLIDFTKLDDELINKLQSLYNTYKSNEEYMKVTDIQYAQSKDDMNIVLSRSPPNS